MSALLKPIVIGLVTLLSLTTAALPAQAAGPDAARAAGWVAAHAATVDQPAAAADALLALAAGQAPDTADEVATLLEVLRTKGPEAVAASPEASAKLAIALDAVGEDPHTFLPGVDLVDQVSTAIGPDGSFGSYPGPFATGLAAAALERSDEEVPGALVARLLADYQNADGGFTFAAGSPSDADSTALALLALLAVEDDANAARAIAWAKANEGPDGSFEGFNKVNSTAILGASLATAGESTDKALGYLRAQQQPSGAFLNGADEDATATTQAALLLGGVSYLDATWAPAGQASPQSPAPAASASATASPTAAPAIPPAGGDPVPWVVGAAAVLVLGGGGLLAARRSRVR